MFGKGVAMAAGTRETSWLANAQVVDVEAGEILADRHVEMADGEIRAISPTLPPGQANVTDVESRFVAPGLISYTR